MRVEKTDTNEKFLLLFILILGNCTHDRDCPDGLSCCKDTNTCAKDGHCKSQNIIIYMHYLFYYFSLLSGGAVTTTTPHPKTTTTTSPPTRNIYNNEKFFFHLISIENCTSDKECPRGKCCKDGDCVDCPAGGNIVTTT